MLRRLLLVATALLSTACGDGPAPAPRGDAPRDPLDLAGHQPPIVMVMVDTLRADRLGCYGCELPTSPVVDALAARAHLFTANTAQCNSTFPSITSVMTGLYVRTHANYVPVPIEGAAQLNDDYASLAERLRDEGYFTAGVVSHPLWVDDPIDTAVRRGWDRYSAISQEIPRAERVTAANAGYTNERTLALLGEYEREHRDQPLFLWVHYFDPHTPYTPPAEYADRWLEHHARELGVAHLVEELRRVPLEERAAWIRARTDLSGRERSDLALADARAQYDGEVANADAAIGELFDRLRALDLFDEALIVFLADHGENLEGRETGRRNIAFTHERLFEPVVLTPLIVKLPGQTEGAESASLTQNVDVAPTIVDLLALPAGPPMEGASLRPLLADPLARVHERAFTESSDNVERAVRDDLLKLIDPGLGEPAAVYRWREDRLELEDVRSSAPSERVAGLEEAMREFRPKGGVSVAFQPWTSDYEVRVEVDVHDGRFLLVEGADEHELASDGSRATFTVRVAGAPREVTLVPDTRTMELAWRVETTGATPLQRVLHLGQTPIERTVVAPLYVLDESAEPPADPAVRLSTERERTADGRERARVRVALAPGPPVELELRPAATAYGSSLEVTGREGFALEELEGRGMVRQGALTRLSADGSRALEAEAVFTDAALAELVLVRRGGAWPAVDRVAVDGRAVRADALAFVFPRPGDGRIASTLLAGPPPGGGPPGSIAIWVQTSGSRVSIDTGNLDPALVEELRALGYVR